MDNLLGYYLFTGALLARITESHQHEFGGDRPTDDEDQRGMSVLTWWLIMLSAWPLILAVFGWVKASEYLKRR